MLQISEIVKKTEEMFDLFNEYFYNKELTRPAITVSPDGGRGAYGWCSIHEIWNVDEENLKHVIQDISNNGYCHNMKFKAPPRPMDYISVYGYTEIHR